MQEPHVSDPHTHDPHTAGSPAPMITVRVNRMIVELSAVDARGNEIGTWQQVLEVRDDA